MPIPPIRVAVANDAPLRADGQYVLYWMIAARRTRFNFALERAVAHATALGRPLVIFEPLRLGYEHASARMHRFVLDGMRDNAAACAAHGVSYLPWVESHAGDGQGLLEHLADRACIVVTDTFPGFFLPRMVAAAARKLSVRLEEVDGNGILPLRLADNAFTAAVHFRRFAQRCWLERTPAFPAPDPLTDAPRASLDVAALIGPRWAPADPALLDGSAPALLDALPIPRAPGPVSMKGGATEAKRRLDRFVQAGLSRYGDRNQPMADATSALSGHLHFGHISAHEVVAAVLEAEQFSREGMAERANGSRAGFFGVSDAAAGFLDQIMTWRELGYGFAWHRPGDFERYDTLPSWALATLDEHAADPRPWTYDLEAFDQAQTHDPLWNAAQRQLVTEGAMHNYLRMLWGKKILHWSPSAAEAFAVMVELNNRYAIDGRDPNSYSGITWVLGRFDRPWGPARPVFGAIRYMTSENTARKLDVAGYLARYGQGRTA